MIEHLRQAWTQLTGPGAPFAVEEIEVRGAPMRVFPSAPRSMRFFWELAATRGDETYLVFEDERYTYAEVDAQVRALAHHLRDRHGVGPGDRVAVAMRNYPEWVIAYWAVTSLGAALVGMNAWWTGPEMSFALADSRPKVLIADEERVERVEPHLDELREASPLHLIAVRCSRELPADASSWEGAVRPETAPPGLPPAEIDPDDDACIFYTSGTTGVPKGAQITHRGSVHNLLHLAFLTTVMAAAETAAGLRPPHDPSAPARRSVFMAPTPLFHVTACNCVMHPATVAGGTLVLMHHWDPARAIELIEREGVTNFSGVPTMSREMLAHPDWQRRDTSSLQGMGGGGAPLHPDLVAKIDRSLPKGGPGTGYGLTETSGIITAASGRIYVDKPRSAGPVVPTLEARVVDPSGAELPTGEAGELCVRGSVVIKGYLNRPEATAEAIAEGWFRTGDIATIDEDGFVTIVDRAKDMLIRGGENVYCPEVEAAIHHHPEVAEVAVFGVPDDRLGETVGAAVLTTPGSTLDAAGLEAFLEPMVARYKIPSRVWFLDEPLPRNANGKFLKRELRDRLVGDPEDQPQRSSAPGE